METSTPLMAPPAPVLRPDFKLSDNLWAERGQVFLTGTQALTRLPAESFPSAVQRRLAESQTIGQLAVQNQAAFASGVQQALVHWQHAVTRSGAEQPTAAAVPDWLKPWAALLPQQGTTAAARKE